MDHRQQAKQTFDIGQGRGNLVLTAILPKLINLRIHLRPNLAQSAGVTLPKLERWRYAYESKVTPPGNETKYWRLYFDFCQGGGEASSVHVPADTLDFQGDGKVSDLVAISFDDVNEADRVLHELNQLQKEYLIDLEDAVVVIRRPDGKINLKQSYNVAGAGAAYGGMSGVAWGTLVGLLFLNPLAGFALGGLIGAATGAISGSLIDYGVDDNFVRSIAEKLTPGSSALFILVRKAQPEKVTAELAKYKGTIIKSSLSPEQEKKLEAAITKARQQDNPVAA
jgi:uncharacterized membrane protein